MDRTTQSVIVALKEEQQKSLEALGDFPKSEPFEHGTQVGFYYGLRKALEIISWTLEDQESRERQF